MGLSLSNIVRGIAPVAQVAGDIVQGYRQDTADAVKRSLADAAARRQADNDAISNELKRAQTSKLLAPPPQAPHRLERDGNQVIDLDLGKATPIEGYATPTPKPDVEFRDGQIVDKASATARPVAGYVAPQKGPSEASIGAAEGRRAQREDRLQQNFQQEPAIKQAGLLSNAVAQLRASASQKTPQGDLNMLYGAVKLRDPNAVREGELALNNKARSAHTQLFALFDRVASGRILTDQERQQILDLVDQTVSEQSKLVAPVQARFGAMARQAGADSAFVAPDPFGGVRKAPAVAAPDAGTVRGLNLQPIGAPTSSLRTQYDAAVSHLKAQGKSDAEIHQVLGDPPE